MRRFGDRLPAAQIRAEFDKTVRQFDAARVRSFIPVLVQRQVAEALRHAT